ncbi:MAG TPA: hypothetical protein VE825_04550 [Terriglobales bacterium]|nr:hypothetical protein [Terriglobales bacterium]
MKALFSGLFLVVALLALPLAAAGPKPQANGTPKYDPATETTIKGTVQEVKTFACKLGGPSGYHLEVKTEKGVVEVHVAASKYLTDYEFQFAVGDEVEVVGSVVQMDGKDAFLARTIKKGQNTYVFRDPKGNPLW